MSNYLSEMREFLNIILDEANGFVDHDCVLKVGEHEINLEMSADLFDDIEKLIDNEIEREMKNRIQQLS